MGGGTPKPVTYHPDALTGFVKAVGNNDVGTVSQQLSHVKSEFGKVAKIDVGDTDSAQNAAMGDQGLLDLITMVSGFADSYSQAFDVLTSRHDTLVSSVGDLTTAATNISTNYSKAGDDETVSVKTVHSALGSVPQPSMLTPGSIPGAIPGSTKIPGQSQTDPSSTG